MRNLNKLILTAAALLFCAVSHAQNGVATFSWVAPTQRVDNTALPASDIVSYTLTSAYCVGTAPNYTMGAVLGTTTIPGNVTTFTKSDFTLDTGATVHCFTLTTVAKDYTTTNGVTTQTGTINSDPSAIVFKKMVAPGTQTTVISAKPDPATGFAVK
jgi:hypothetical protein